jgi:hypothetical protein
MSSDGSEQTSSHSEAPRRTARVISGRTVVVAMLAFGLLMTGLMFTYWELYTRPFRPLQAAIAERFPKSIPRVIGGRHKSHQPGSPSTLRIIVRIPTDPRNNEAVARQWANQLVEIAGEHIRPGEYERVEVFLMHRRPERFTVTWSVAGPWKTFPLPEQGDLPEPVQVEIDTGQEGT